VQRLITLGLCATLLGACAEGGLSDEELNAAQDDAKGDDDDGDDDDGTTASKDGGAGKDAGTSSDGGKRDASSAASNDAGKTTTSTKGDGGSSSSLPTIKCPSNLVCTSDVSFVLSALDPNVKSDTLVCAQSGLLPMPVSCKSDDECKSARLTSGKCTGSYCIQACTK
jgi:hypothetical protein